MNNNLKIRLHDVKSDAKFLTIKESKIRFLVFERKGIKLKPVLRCIFERWYR
jgi:hypothetical protein